MLRELPAPDTVPGSYRSTPVALLAGDDSPLLTPIAEELRGRGWTVHTGAGTGDLETRLDLVVTCVEATDPADPDSALRDALLLAGETQPLLEKCAAAGGRVAYVTVTRLDGRLGLSGEVSADRAALGGVTGLVKTLAIEAPALFCRAVDLAPELTPRRCAELVVDELHDVEIGLREVGHAADGKRRTVALAADGDGSLPGAGTAAGLTADDLLVVTGGARGVTAACVTELARSHQAGLLLLGRSPLDEEPPWARGVAADRLRAEAAAELKRAGGRPTPREVEAIARRLLAAREVRRTLEEIRQAGAEAEYLPVDVTDAQAVREALVPYRERISGVVHGAGVLADGLIVDKKAQDVDRVLRTKLSGLRNVLQAFPEDGLRHLLLFSSVAGFFGNQGQSDYAMANEALNRFACTLRGRFPHSRIVAVNWGAWAGGMVTPALERMFAERGVPLIPLEEGTRRFVEQFSPARASDTVCVVGPKTPLSSPENEPVPASGVLVHRDLAALASDPAVRDHVIGGKAVLPATFAIGAALNVVDRAVAGSSPVAVRGFQVQKGVVFDAEQPAELRFEIRPSGEGGGCFEVGARDETGRPRYRLQVLTGDAASPPPVADLPAPGSGTPAPYYEDGTLFHGPALRGITSVLARGESLVLEGRLPDAPSGAAGADRAPGYDPVLADLLLQAVLVWARVERGRAVLPTAVGAVDLCGGPRPGQPVLLVVDRAEDTASGVRCRATACAPDGRVLLRCEDVEAVQVPGLGEKFQSAASARS